MQTSPYNPRHVNTTGLGCARFARRYSGHRKNLLPDFNGAFAPAFRNEFLNLMLSIRSERNFRILLSIPLGTEMFHFPRFALHTQVTADDSGVSPFDISGSKVIWHSRNLSQLYHVLHRFLAKASTIHSRSHRKRCTPLYIILRRRPEIHNSGPLMSRELTSLVCDNVCLGRKDPIRIIVSIWISTRQTYLLARSR